MLVHILLFLELLLPKNLNFNQKGVVVLARGLEPSVGLAFDYSRLFDFWVLQSHFYFFDQEMDLISVNTFPAFYEDCPSVIRMWVKLISSGRSSLFTLA